MFRGDGDLVLAGFRGTRRKSEHVGAQLPLRPQRPLGGIQRALRINEPLESEPEAPMGWADENVWLISSPRR